MNGIFVSGQSAVKKESLVKGFFVSIPAQISRSSITILQAKEAYYIPEQAGDKRSGGWHLKQTTPGELPSWPQDQDDVLKPLGNGEYFLKTRNVDLDTIVRVKNWFMYQPTVRLLRELDRPGNTQHASLAVTFHMRLTRPLLGMILVLLGLSVILRDQNRNVFISAGMCLLLCVVFFASIFACQFLGKTGVEIISPALAAWLPVLLFGPASFVMFDMVHT
jgi:lipopolysaccharide export system permease protein